MHPRHPATRLLLSLALAAGGTLSATSPGSVRTEQELRVFYQRACAMCHGEDGSALSPTGRRLKGRDFTAQEGLSGDSDQALVKAIQNGIYFGLKMPAYRRELTDEEALVLVRSILRRARRGEPIRSQAPPSEPQRAQAAASADNR